MDETGFDRWTRSLALALSRRVAIRGILGAAVGRIGFVSTDSAHLINAQAATPTPVPGVSGDSYYSGVFGYRLAWNKTWRVVSTTTKAHQDQLVLSNGTSTVTFSGLSTNADPNQALAEVKAAFFSGRQGSNPTISHDDFEHISSDRATITYTYQQTTTGSSSSERKVTFDCLSLVPGKSVLGITHDVASNDAASQRAPYAMLLAGLVIPLYGVKTYTGLSHLHTLGRVTYPQVPPVGGPHNPIWQNCGFYDVPVANEHAVHSMEHGAVWITFVPNLSAAQVAIIKQLAQTVPYVLASPYPGLPAPVVASAWGAQLKLSDADEIRLRSFIAIYQYGPDTEKGAPCSGGTSSPSF